MKNRFVIFVSIIFIGIAAAKTFAGSQSENKKSITIGFIGKSQSNPVFIAAYAGARVAAKEIGEKSKVSVVINWQTPQNEDPQEQVQAIERLIETGVDAIAVACSDAGVLTPAIDKAVDKGIPVICYDSDAPKSKRFAYYGTDDHEFGKLMMHELAREMKSKGVVAMIAGNKDAPNLQRRVRAFTEELQNYPGMKLLTNGVLYHKEIPQKAADAVARAQKANPQIGGWAFIGGWPLFIKNAIKWKPGQVKIVACDALPIELEYLKSGHVQSLIAQNCFLWGYKSVELLLNRVLRNQKTTEEFIIGPLILVTNENVEEWSLNWKKWLMKEAVYR
jgi:ribose transport system substrate-binding protein